MAPHAATAAAADHDLGWILLAFAIFNAYMLILATQVNITVFIVFLTLQATEVLLLLGNFKGDTSLVHIGGYLGVATAAAAWYASAADVANGTAGRIKLPVGPPAPRSPPGLHDRLVESKR